MKLSILINNYNYARFLPECIDSVLAQDYPDREVIVVDDGSTDESRAIIAGYGGAIVPVLKANGGQASSFNAGFAAASGDILLLLDADDAFLPGKLRHIARLYADHKLDWCFDRVTTEPGTAIAETPRITLVDKRAAIRAGGFPTLPVPTSGLSFRREILGRILPMPVASGVVLSDNYLKFAAAFLGAGAIVETPLTFQRIHDSNRYTGTTRANTLKPEIMLATGLHLARAFAGMGAMGRSLAAGGIAGAGLSIGGTWAEIRRVSAEAGALGWSAPALGLLVARKRVAAMLRRGGEAA